MPDGKQTYVPPAIDKTAFNCPHCGAYAAQNWYLIGGRAIKDVRTYNLLHSLGRPNNGRLSIVHKDPIGIGDQARQGSLEKKTDSDFIDNNALINHISNAYISECFNCRELCFWVHNRLIWPQNGEAPPPNPDLPDDIRADYLEASGILDLSPRGAAALLRLAVQKLCKALGENGDNINDDIRSLVRKGLDSRVQKALDIVRVIGNNAVHPGQMDLSDDRRTAETLFSLVNLIADIMISEPKRIDDMYEQLPEGARAGIERRDQT